MEDILRVYFDDDTWVTVPARSTTTARELVAVIAKKRRVPPAELLDCALVACEQGDEQSFERRLDDDENLFDIRESARQHGQLSAFKFLWRNTKTRSRPAAGV